MTIAKTDNQRPLITTNAVPIFFKPKNTGVQSVLNVACNAHKAKATCPSTLRAARIPTYDKIIYSTVQAIGKIQFGGVQKGFLKREYHCPVGNKFPVAAVAQHAAKNIKKNPKLMKVT